MTAITSEKFRINHSHDWYPDVSEKYFFPCNPQPRKKNDFAEIFRSETFMMSFHIRLLSEADKKHLRAFYDWDYDSLLSSPTFAV